MKTKNTEDFKRLMIIVWSWRKGDSHFTQEYDSWNVQTEDSQDKIFRIDRSNSKASKKLIYNLVAAHLEGSYIYIFLHRSHHYAQADVDDMLAHFQQQHQIEQQAIKCFLFGEERDYIYISTQNEGLLGAKGTFGGRIKKRGMKEEIEVKVVIDEEKKIIDKKHFDKVWEYYSYEFKQKIYELKEELWLAFPCLIRSSELLTAAGTYKRLKEKEKDSILLRLRSFTNRLRPDSKNEEQLKWYEDKKQKSYFFDDCNENLKKIYGDATREKYQDLVQYIDRELFNTVINNKVERPSSERWKELRFKFDELLNTMPEATFY